MNSWDDDPDELLRQRWQQTFANFKVEAHPSLGDRILNALPAGRWPRRAYTLVGLLLLMSVGLLYPLRLGERPYSDGNVTMVWRTTPAQPLLDSRVRRSGAVSGRLLSPPPVGDSRPGKFVVRRQYTVTPPTGTGVIASRVDVSFQNRTTRKPSSTDQARLRSKTSLRLGATTVSIDHFQAGFVRLVGTRLPVQLAGSGATGGSESVVTPTERSVRDNTGSSSLPQPPQLSDVQPSANIVSVEWTRLKPVEILPLSSRLSTLSGQLPTIAVVPSHPVETVIVRRHQHWFAEVVPLNSFQWMSVSPVATAYLSLVKAPAAFSPATWGCQVKGGIRWQHWQAHLSLGQVRRWAYYMVNENRYRVEPRPDNPNQLVRETYIVAENVSLPMIGVGLSQETLLDRGRYAVDLGGQATYLPTGQQAMISLQGGVGRRLVMSRAIRLQVGLRAEYGLNRLLSEQQHLVIHPLLIGIGFRIQPRSFR